MVIKTERVIMLEIVTTTMTKTSTWVTMVTEMIGVGPMFQLKNGKLLVGMVELKWHELEICRRK